MNELELLQKRVGDLEYKLSLFNKPDGFVLEKPYTQINPRKLGFFGLPPILQPSSTGTTLDMTVNGGTAVTEDNGFGGDSGPTFYTIGDIVKHLKLLGLLKK